MKNLLPALALSVGLGAPIPAAATDGQAVHQFCQKIQQRSTVIQQNSMNNDKGSHITFINEAPQVSPEYVSSILQKVAKMARTIQYWDAHCPKDSETTWEMGLTYETVVELNISQEELDKQLADRNSLFYQKLLKKYVRFVSGAYGEFSARSAYPSIDEQVGRKRLFPVAHEAKKIENRVNQGAISPRDGILHSYRLFQKEGTPYTDEK